MFSIPTKNLDSKSQKPLAFACGAPLTFELCGIHHIIGVINCLHIYVHTDKFCFVAYFYFEGRARKCI